MVPVPPVAVDPQPAAELLGPLPHGLQPVARRSGLPAEVDAPAVVGDRDPQEPSRRQRLDAALVACACRTTFVTASVTIR